jgi:DNA-binding response OmpR family regulator/signal transduction histidine kinase
MLSGILQQDGLQVTSFQNAEDALALMSAQVAEKGPPDVIVTDLYTPGLDGWQFCQLLRSMEYPSFNTTPILITSPASSSADAREVISSLGANGFLTAPYTPSALRSEVRKLMQRQEPQDTATVLIVTSDQERGMTLRTAFEGHGYQVDLAQSVKEVEHSLDNRAPDLAVIFPNLEDTHPSQLLERIKTQGPATIVLLVSADADTQRSVELVKKGVDGFVREPLNVEHLIDLCSRTRREQSLVQVEELLGERTKELRLSEVKQQILLDSISDPILALSGNLTVLYCNDFYGALAGKPTKDLVGANLEVLMPHRGGDWMRDLFSKTLYEGTAQEGEGSLGNRYYHMRVFPTPSGILSVAQDSTERKKAQADEYLHLQKLESLFNIAGLLTKPQPLSLKYRQILDELTRVARVEFASLRILDESTQQLKLLAFSGPDGVEPPPDELPMQSPSGMALQEGSFKIEGASSPESTSNGSSADNSGTICIIPLIGERPLGVVNVASARAGHFTPDLVKLLTAIGEGLGALMENAHLSDEREQLARQLVQSQKLETVGQLAAGVAHDFNNLLTMIMGYAYSGLSKLPPGSPAESDLEEIEKAAGRAEELTQKLLAFSMRGEIDHQAINVNELITGMEFMLSRLMGEDIDLILSLEPDLDEVMADQGRLEQILVNLALNAKDAMPNGGKLTIQTGGVRANPNGTNRPSGTTGAEHVTIPVPVSVTEMTQAVKDRVFEPFFSTKGTGSGLGLSTSYGIIKQGGGHIGVESAPGKGSSFKIYLPALDPTPEATQRSRSMPGLPVGTETVLLVEDEASLRQLAASTLRGQGYEVLEASDGSNALQVAKERTLENIDLLLTDVVMPRMDGRQLAQRLSAEHPALKVLYCSGYAYDSLGQHGVLESGAQILHKPFTPPVLARKVREVLDQ